MMIVKSSKMTEVIVHTLGLCGDIHPTLASLLLEVPQIGPIFNLIKQTIK